MKFIADQILNNNRLVNLKTQNGNYTKANTERKRLESLNKDSVAFGTVSNSIIFMQLQSQKKQSE